MGTIAILAYDHFMGTRDPSFTPIVILVGGCLLADILDGALARKLGVDGALGIQLDSLADVISFGVLPAYVFYHLPFSLFGNEFEKGAHLILAALIAVSAGLRLARFNVDIRPREYFWGLATPAGSILVIALAWSMYSNNYILKNSGLSDFLSWFVPVFLIIMYQVALKLPGLKSPKPGLWTMIVIAVLTVVGLFVIGPIAISIGIFVYVVAGMMNLVIKWY